MQPKTIERKLDAIFAKWLQSITDEELRKDLRRDTIITGGSIASMLLNEKVKDYDLYFRTEATAMKVARYFTAMAPDLELEVAVMDGRVKIAGKFTSQKTTALETEIDETEGEKPVERIRWDDDGSALPSLVPVYFSPNAITLDGGIQLVIRFHGEAADIHKNYDFIHCTNYWESITGKLTTNLEALESLLTKRLQYVGSLYPLCSIIRTRKFLRRGWSINAGQFLKMAMQLNDFDLSDIRVLQEQLIGVDSAYFDKVLAELEKSGKTNIDSAYACEIIDRIF